MRNNNNITINRDEGYAMIGEDGRDMATERFQRNFNFFNSSIRRLEAQRNFFNYPEAVRDHMFYTLHMCRRYRIHLECLPIRDMPIRVIENYKEMTREWAVDVYLLASQLYYFRMDYEDGLPN